MLDVVAIFPHCHQYRRHKTGDDTEVKEESNYHECFQLEDNPAYGGVNIYEEIK